MTAPVSKPMFLFKYVTLQGLANILHRRGLKWTCPLEFNDPFDLRRDLRFGFSEEIFFDRYKARSLELLGNDETVRNNPESWANMRSKRERVAGGEDEAFWESQKDTVMGTHRQQVQQFQDGWNEQVKKYRALCLSEVECDLLMWAHYADMHRGAVVRFKVMEDSSSHFRDAKSVTYSQNPPHIASLEDWVDHCIGTGATLDDKEIFHRIVFTKSKHWEYEKEWRCIVESDVELKPGQIQLYNIDPKEIDGVVFGYRSDSATTAIITKYVSNELPHVKIYHAHLKQSEYGLEYRPFL